MSNQDKVNELLARRYRIRELMGVIASINIEGITVDKEDTPDSINQSLYRIGVAIESEIGYQMHQDNLDKLESEGE